MARKDLEKVTIRLTQGARDELQTLFPDVGYNVVVRSLVDNFLKGVKERISQGSTNNIDATSINIELGDLNDAE